MASRKAIEPKTVPIAVPLVFVAGAAMVGASPFLLSFLSKWESSGNTRLVVYADRLAGGLPTVCDGLTRHVTRTPIVVGEVWTKAECEQETQQAVLNVQRELAPCFKRPPNQMVWDMATSHAWNFGAPATCGSLAMSAWNAGAWEVGCRRIAQSDSGTPQWSYICTGVGETRHCEFLQGLANRRQDEWKHCAESLQ